MRSALVLLSIIAGLGSGASQAQPAYAIRQAGNGLQFHYGVVPAEVVLALFEFEHRVPGPGRAR